MWRSRRRLPNGSFRCGITGSGSSRSITTRSSLFFNSFIAGTSMKARGSGWPSAGGLSSGIAAASGSIPLPAKELRFISRSPRSQGKVESIWPKRVLLEVPQMLDEQRTQEAVSLAQAPVDPHVLRIQIPWPKANAYDYLAENRQERNSEPIPMEILLVDDNPGDIRMILEGLKEALPAAHLSVAE